MTHSQLIRQTHEVVDAFGGELKIDVTVRYGRFENPLISTGIFTPTDGATTFIIRDENDLKRFEIAIKEQNNKLKSRSHEAIL